MVNWYETVIPLTREADPEDNEELLEGADAEGESNWREGTTDYPNLINEPDFIVQIGPLISKDDPALWVYVRK